MVRKVARLRCLRLLPEPKPEKTKCAFLGSTAIVAYIALADFTLYIPLEVALGLNVALQSVRPSFEVL
jgi:hypothetical protein